MEILLNISVASHISPYFMYCLISMAFYSSKWCCIYSFNKNGSVHILFAHLLMSNGQCDCSSQFLIRKMEVFQIFQRGFNNTGNWLQRWWRDWGAQNTKYSKISNRRSRRSPRGDQGKGCHQGSCSLNLAAEHGSRCCAAQSWKIK